MLQRDELTNPRERGRVGFVLIAVLVTSVTLGVVLSLFTSADTEPAEHWKGVVALIAGLAVPVGASVSIVRRTPVFVTPADRVTLARGVLAGGCATLTVWVLAGALPPQSWAMVLLAAPAYLLDAVDGWVARRTGTATAEGGRLDMETDAAFVMTLSVAAVFVVGPLVLVLGGMRYLFVLASIWRPSWRGELRFSHFRRVIGGFQGFVLVLILVPTTPEALATAGAFTAFALLLISFGRDILALERSHRE